MRKEHSVKINILMYIAMILICVTLFSICLVSNMYAKYTESIDNSDGARIAKFSITPGGELFENLKAEAIPGETQNVTLIIENKSEVAVEYTLTVTNVTRNLPLKFTLTPDPADGGNTPHATLDSYDKDNGISISSARREPKEHTDKYKLKIIWEPNSNNKNDLELMGMVDYITVSVKATQID